MNKKIILYILFLLAIFEFSGSAFSASPETSTPQTVREMQESIQNLEQERNLLEFKWNNFKVWSSSLWELIDANLSESDKNQLQTIVEAYNDKRISWEKVLKKIVDTNGNKISQRKVLLLLKKDFYTSIRPYIAEDKIENFLSYIATDLSLNEKGKDVDSEIVKIQSSKTERVEEIKTKIEDNNKILRASIENKISTQVRQKLDMFVNGWDFSNLSNESKISIFNRVITKLEYESIRLTNLQNSTSIIEEKIIVFRVMINLLKEYTA